jgi:hypothetical protein
VAFDDDDVVDPLARSNPPSMYPLDHLHPSQSRFAWGT